MSVTATYPDAVPDHTKLPATMFEHGQEPWRPAAMRIQVNRAIESVNIVQGMAGALRVSDDADFVTASDQCVTLVSAKCGRMSGETAGARAATWFPLLADAVLKHLSRAWTFSAQPAALAFLDQEGLFSQFDLFVSLAETIFRPMQIDSIEVEADPEEPDDEWVVLTVKLRNVTADRAFALYEEFVSASISDLPARLSGRFRLSLDLDA